MDGVATGTGLWDHPVLADDVPDAEVLAGDREGDVGGGAGRELEFLEAAELTDRSVETVVGGELDISILEKLGLGREKVGMCGGILTAERLPFQSWLRYS